MRIPSYTLSGGGAASTAAFAALQVTAAGVPMTLTGAAAAISPPREVTLTSAADFSTITFIVTGTDRRQGGNVITETITGPGAGLTVQGLKVFATITSIVPSAANAANTVSAGYPARVVGAWINTNLFRSVDNTPTIRSSTQIISGAPAGKWEYTNENVVTISGDGAFVDGTVASTPAVAGDTASIQGAYVRYVLTSAAGSLKIRFVRPSF